MLRVELTRNSTRVVLIKHLITIRSIYKVYYKVNVCHLTAYIHSTLQFSVLPAHVIRTGIGMVSFKVKIRFLYSAVTSPHSCSKRITLNVWQTCTSEHHLDKFGKHPATLQFMRDDYSCKSIHHCL